MVEIVLFGGKPTSKAAIVRETDCVYAIVKTDTTQRRTLPTDYVYLLGQNVGESESEYRTRVLNDFKLAYPRFPNNNEIGNEEISSRFELAETAYARPSKEYLNEISKRLIKQPPLHEVYKGTKFGELEVWQLETHDKKQIN